ncbi:MAG: hypothetical protein J6Y88_03480 [Bacteroidales bacterium]|nr:hypothetical protein [Bacteroidales bacterium]
MKKILNTLALLLIAFAAFGQKTTTSWPYLYSDFANGTVYMKDGKKHDQEFNIHLAKGRLHFNDNGVIKEVKTNDIHLVELNGELFTSLQGFVVKVIGDPQTGYVAVHTYADYQKLNESDGPYGTKLDATTSYSVTPYDLTGVAGSYDALMRNRNEGVTLPLKNDYYIVAGGRVFNASKKGIESNLDDAGKAAFKTFQKQNKIKWQDPQSLLLLVDFLNQL